VGAAFVARRAKAELSQGVDFGAQAAGAIAAQVGPQGQTISNVNPANGNPIVTPGSADGSVDVQGTGWGYGAKLGLTYDPTPSLHFGLGYQSEIRETIKGTATFTVPGSVGQGLQALGGLPANQGAWQQGTLAGLGNEFALQTANGSASAAINLPATISLGMIYDLSSTFSLAAEIAQTRWSTFKELRVKFTDSSSQPDRYTTENWKNAMFMALGATCHPGNQWTYRMGVALDKTPVPDATRTPRIPDADRVWLSGGVSYQFTKAFGVDAGYSHLFCKDSTVNLQGGSDPNNPAYFDGNLSGTYKNTIDILAVQARYSF
jgi:long-chain fatty acid transport protein